MIENLYVLVPKGIGEQAPAGIFRSGEAAVAAAERLWVKSDGYHGFELHVMEVGTVYDSFSRGERYGLTEDPFDRDKVEVKSNLKEFEG